jgi:hypothetical protein
MALQQHRGTSSALIADRKTAAVGVGVGQEADPCVDGHGINQRGKCLQSATC